MNKNIIQDVEKVLRDQDPIDLIAEGAPEDEYEGEAELIARKLRETPSEEALRIYVVDLIKLKFSVEINTERLELLVKKLLEIQI